MKKITRKQAWSIKNKPFFRSAVFGIDVVAQDKKDIDKIKKALLLIKKIDPRLFSKVLQLKAILIYPGRNEYGAVYEKERIYIDQPKAIKESTLIYLASSIVHEAWHIDQYKRKIREYGIKTEKGAYLVQKRFLLKAGAKADAEWLDKMYKQQWWKPEPTKTKKKAGYDDKSVEKTRNEFWKFLNKYKKGKLRILDYNGA